jgi:hypothetical protein
VPGSGEPVSVKITTPAPVVLAKDQTKSIVSQGKPLPGTYKWTTSDATVAAIQGSDTGATVQVKGGSPGKATLTVRFTCDSVDQNGVHPFAEATIEVIVLNLVIEELSFIDDLSIKKDVVGSITDIVDPVWKRTNPTSDNNPGAYVRDTKMKVTLKISVTPAPTSPVTGITIEGNAAGLGKFTKSGITIPAATEFTVSGIECDTKLPNSTKYFNPLKIDWKYTADGTNFAELNDTENKIYATLAAPTDTVYLTSLHLAVSKDGSTDAAGAFAKSWSFFGDGTKPTDVTGWDGRKFVYYPAGTPFSGCATNVIDLLTSATGGARCGAFGRFFLNVGAVNGIPITLVAVQPTDDGGFLVKNWTYSATSFPGAPDGYEHKYISPGAGFNEMTPVPPGGLYGDMQSDTGVAGQNSPTPSQKFHVDHAIVLFGGKYYDPSYGLEYANEEEFETKALDGYVSGFMGDPARNYRVRKSMGLKKTKFTPVP